MSETASAQPDVIQDMINEGGGIEEEDSGEGMSRAVSHLRMKLTSAQVSDLHMQDAPSSIWSFDKSPQTQEEDFRSFLGEIDRSLEALKRRQTKVDINQSPNQSIYLDGEEECSDSDKDGLEDRPESEFAHNSEMSFLAAAMANLPNFDPAKASLVHADNVVIEKVRRLLEDNAAADGSEQEDSKAQDISTSLQTVDLSRIDYESKATGATQCWSAQQQLLLADFELEREMTALQTALRQAASELDEFVVDK